MQLLSGKVEAKKGNWDLLAKIKPMQIFEREKND
jgi:hypothetical protein